jgi:hypothetical protein
MGERERGREGERERGREGERERGREGERERISNSTLNTSDNTPHFFKSRTPLRLMVWQGGFERTLMVFNQNY